jgi:hypothetical protein
MLIQRHCQWRLMIANKKRDEPRWISRADILCELVNAIRRFVKALSSPVDGFRLPFYMDPYSPFDHVGDQGAWVTVAGRRFARGVPNVHDRGDQVCSIQIRQRPLSHDVCARERVRSNRSRVAELERLITYMKSKPGVWFATEEDVANYIKKSIPKR